MFPSIDQAIGQFEGFGTPGTIATRQNNPGDLMYGPFAQSQGATGAGTGNIAIFPNSQTGFAAMDQLIQNYASQGYNIQDLIKTWAPANAPGNTPESTQNYINYVSNKTGVAPNAPVSSAAQNPTSSCNWWDLPCMWRYTASPKGVSTLAGKATGLPNLAGWNFGRIVAIIVGVICIGGAIFLFKPETFLAGVTVPEVLR